MKQVLIACVSIVNAIFAFKYGIRLLPLTAAVAVSVAYGVGYAVMGNWVCRTRSAIMDNGRLWLCCLLAVAALMIAIMCVVDYRSNNVDRWSAIHNFLEYLLAGRYPYAAPTHLGGYGSPFPAWQLWHLPYYLMGHVGYSWVVCLLLFFWSLSRLHGVCAAFKALVMLVTSLPFWYEVTVVSDLMPNMMLVAAFVNWFKMDDAGGRSVRCLAACSVVCGLFFSTRLAVFIPLFYALFPTWMEQPAWRRVWLVMVAVATFALTFLPFALWDGDMLFFFQYNPFILQARQGSPVDSILLLMVLLTVGLYYGRRVPYMTATALTLFGFIAFVFAGRMVESCFAADFWSGVFDHTYLSMCLPFALIAVNSKRPV